MRSDGWPKAEVTNSKKKSVMELTPDEQEELRVENWVRELKEIQMASQSVQETVYQMLPTETIMRMTKKYGKKKKEAEVVLGLIQESLRKQAEMLEEVKRDLG